MSEGGDPGVIRAVNCELCQTAEAEVLVAIPMCGERPKYRMCVDCASEVGAHIEEATPLRGWSEVDDG